MLDFSHLEALKSITTIKHISNLIANMEKTSANGTNCKCALFTTSNTKRIFSKQSTSWDASKNLTKATLISRQEFKCVETRLKWTLLHKLKFSCVNNLILVDNSWKKWEKMCWHWIHQNFTFHGILSTVFTTKTSRELLHLVFSNMFVKTTRVQTKPQHAIEIGQHFQLLTRSTPKEMWSNPNTMRLILELLIMLKQPKNQRIQKL